MTKRMRRFLESWDDVKKLDGFISKRIMGWEGCKQGSRTLKRLAGYDTSLRTCYRCMSKLADLLAHTKDMRVVEQKILARHPHVKDIHRYAQNAVRETTGWGAFDDYIIKHRLWQVRDPVLAPPHLKRLLEKRVELLAVCGRALITNDRSQAKAARVQKEKEAQWEAKLKELGLTT